MTPISRRGLAEWAPTRSKSSSNCAIERTGCDYPPFCLAASEKPMDVNSVSGLSAAEIIRLLDLHPHPEGGHFRETFRDPVQDAQGRAVSTLIYFLLSSGEMSRWHKVDAAEVWHYYGGAALELKISRHGSEISVQRLGLDLVAGERPQFVVPSDCWQSATSLGPWTLVGCTVAPGFEFSGFKLAPPHYTSCITVMRL